MYSPVQKSNAMKSIKNIGNTPAGINLASDEIIEFHAARILLLIALCGKKPKGSNVHAIEGLTKLAKLDFFVRYPSFFNRITTYLKKQEQIDSTDVESKMIRFHYGPWDKRYYQVLPFLEAREIIRVTKKDQQYIFSLTPLGEGLAKQLKENDSYADLTAKMRVVGKTFRATSGSRLKDIIYEVFKNEVANKNLDDIINY
jgi:hypothetical protein